MFGSRVMTIMVVLWIATLLALGLVSVIVERQIEEQLLSAPTTEKNRGR